MMMICPDCPKLIPLNSPEGLKSVHEAVKKFNQNTTNQHIYILQEVGRIRSGVQECDTHTHTLHKHLYLREFIWLSNVFIISH